MLLSPLLESASKLITLFADIETKLLNWKLSDDAKKYYNDQDNKKFNSDIENGDTKLPDAIRKEKQERINILINKEKLKTLSVVILIMSFVNGCIHIIFPSSIDKPNVDVNSLKTSDRTWNLYTNQPINIRNDNGKQEISYFNENWFLVHKDWIKTFNENQNFILEILKDSNRVVYTTNVVNQMLIQ